MRRAAFFASSAIVAACSSTALFDGPDRTRTDLPPTSVPTSLPPRPPDAPPPLRSVTSPLVVDLGMVGDGTEVFLDVPKNALGFVVIVHGGGTHAGIEQVRSPSGVVVHSAFTPVGGDQQTSLSEMMSLATVAVPMGDLAASNPPEPGKWTLRFAAPDAPSQPDAGPPVGLHAEARIQVGSPAGFAGGRLDLDVHLPEGLRLDGRLLSASNAASDTAIASRLDAFYDGLVELFGIDRGEVRFHDASNELVAVNTEPRLLAGFAVAAEARQSLAVLFTTSIDLGGGNAAWGVAPGVPGAAITSGTEMSGVILAVGEAPATGDGLALLHEAGHFFGLTHTTELDGQFGDPLADTPRCLDIDVADPLSVFRCPDVGNLMFPTFDGAGGFVLDSTASQSRVFRGSPVYKAYAETTGGKTKKSGRLVRDSSRALRAKTRAEAWLASTICMHARRRGVPPFAGDVAELRAAAEDPSLPGALRRRAAGLLPK
jgi:hypothetical protein